MDFFKIAVILGMVVSAVLQAQNPTVQPTVPQVPGYAPAQPQPGYAPQSQQAQPGYVPQQQPQQQGNLPKRPSPADLQLSPQEGAALEQAYADTANVAAQWLKMIDDGKYGESWDFASQLFQFTLKRKEWEVAEEKLRAPMGRLISRQLVLQAPAKDPKNLPKGDYMVLEYKASFANRPEVSELVTMIKESDGKWRVLTYQAA